MKRYLIGSLLLFLSLYVSAQVQLKNSQWKGYIKELKNADMKVAFKEDTVIFYYASPSDQQGLFTFTQNKDTLTIIKVSGPGGCPAMSKGIYTIETLDNGNKFLLHIVSDECTGRIRSFTANPYERIQ